MVKHMMDKPYIQKVLRELEYLGYDDAKGILLRYYRPVKRSLGLYLNAYDFAREIDSLNNAVLKKYNPDDPDQIYIGHLKERLKRKDNDY